MRCEPHENLTIWSIRYEHFGPGRYDHHNHRCDVPEVRHCEPRPCALDAHRRPDAPKRVVEQTHGLSQVDCYALRGGDATGSQPAVRMNWPWGVNALPIVDYITVPADIAPPSEPGAIQGYIYGQAVPTHGNLLDILA